MKVIAAIIGIIGIGGLAGWAIGRFFHDLEADMEEYKPAAERDENAER